MESYEKPNGNVAEGRVITVDERMGKGDMGGQICLSGVVRGDLQVGLAKKFTRNGTKWIFARAFS